MRSSLNRGLQIPSDIREIRPSTCFSVIVAMPLGIAVAVAAIWLADQGYFARWRELPPPPSSVTAIHAADPYALCVDTAPGAVYCWYHYRAQAGWMAATPEVFVELPPSTPFPREGNPPGTVRHRVDFSYPLQENVQYISYSILTDGTIWEWRHSRGMGILFAYPVAALCGGLVALIASLVILRRPKPTAKTNAA